MSRLNSRDSITGSDVSHATTEDSLMDGSTIDSGPSTGGFSASGPSNVGGGGGGGVGGVGGGGGSNGLNSERACLCGNLMKARRGKWCGSCSNRPSRKFAQLGERGCRLCLFVNLLRSSGQQQQLIDSVRSGSLTWDWKKVCLENPTNAEHAHAHCSCPRLGDPELPDLPNPPLSRIVRVNDASVAVCLICQTPVVLVGDNPMKR